MDPLHTPLCSARHSASATADLRSADEHPKTPRHRPWHPRFRLGAQGQRDQRAGAGPAGGGGVHAGPGPDAPTGQEHHVSPAVSCFTQPLLVHVCPSHRTMPLSPPCLTSHEEVPSPCTCTMLRMKTAGLTVYAGLTIAAHGAANVQVAWREPSACRRRICSAGQLRCAAARGVAAAVPAAACGPTSRAHQAGAFPGQTRGTLTCGLLALLSMCLMYLHSGATECYALQSHALCSVAHEFFIVARELGAT